MTHPPEIQWLSLTVGPLMSNCHLLYKTDSREAVLFDPGADAGLILDTVRARDLAIPAVCLTHGHADHIGAVEAVLDGLTPTPEYIAPALEKEFLSRGIVNLSAMFGEPITTRPADRWLDGGEQLQLGGMSFEIRLTPGHTPGGLSWVCRPTDDSPIVVVTGDLIFQEGIGRTDFPGGSMSALESSIRSEIYTLPDDTILLPGHGPSTTVGHEKKYNPFVKF